MGAANAGVTKNNPILRLQHIKSALNFYFFNFENVSYSFLTVHVVFLTGLLKLGKSTTTDGLRGKCGVCGKQVELPTDRKSNGKVAYFEKSK